MAVKHPQPKGRPAASRGFILTVDSMIALGFAMGIIAFLSYASSTGPSVFPYTIAAQDYAEELGNVLDQLGYLGMVANSPSNASTWIYAAMKETLPPGYSAMVNTSVYSYVPSGSCPAACQLSGSSPINQFCLCNNQVVTLANQSMQNASFLATTTRVFYTNSSSSQWYGLCSITVWVK